MRVSYGLISVVVLALVAVGCSGDGDRSGIASLELEVNDTFPDSGAPGPDPIADTEEAMLAFTQ